MILITDILLHENEKNRLLRLDGAHHPTLRQFHTYLSKPRILLYNIAIT